MTKNKTFLHKALCWLCVLCWSVCPLSLHAQQEAKYRKVSIQLVQKGTQDPVLGNVQEKGGKTYSTDEKGLCQIEACGHDTLILAVSALGYENLGFRRYILKGKNHLSIALSPVDQQLGTAQIVAQRKPTTVLQQTVSIDQSTMEQNTSLSLAKMLENAPGVSSISTGGTIAKPVIQGMHSSRILVVNNGVRLESQNWGIDHAPEVDHTSTGVVEVVKGAESIRYGYGAIGGVVLMDQKPLPFGHDQLVANGKVNWGYSSNGHGYDGTSTLDLGYRRVALRLHGMYQKAGDYSTAEYLLNNTGYNNISMAATLGYRHRNLTANLHSSLYYSRSGIYYGSKVTDMDQLLARFTAGRPEAETLRPFSYAIEPPFQQSQHFLLKGEAKWHFNEQHQLDLSLAYQNNLRQEFENRKVERFSWIPVQDLQLTTFNGEAIWKASWEDRWKQGSQFGLSSMYQYNYNVPGTKQPAFIPNFAALTTGFFLLHKAQIGALTASAGMRYDIRAMAVNGYTSLSSYKYYDDFKFYSNFTASIAGYYQFSEHLDLRANLGWAWRPPDINELYSYGVHHGSYWVEGNRELTSERGYKAVLGGGYRTSLIAIEPSMFYQRLTNYIYDNIGSGSERFQNTTSGKYPKFVYGQDDARFLGGDLNITIEPLEQLRLVAKGEWIYARNLTQDAWFPFMPSDRYGLDARYQWKAGRKDQWSGFVSLGGKWVTQQTRFESTKDLVPESPPAYGLLEAAAEVTLKLPHGRSLKLMFIGHNLTNHLYKEYTDRFRYYAHERGRQMTLRTIFNF